MIQIYIAAGCCNRAFPERLLLVYYAPNDIQLTETSCDLVNQVYKMRGSTPLIAKDSET